MYISKINAKKILLIRILSNKEKKTQLLRSIPTKPTSGDFNSGIM